MRHKLASAGSHTRLLILVVCVLVGAALRLARLLERPFIHADGPGYIAMARHLAPGDFGRALTGYYPPLFPLALRAVREATGLDWEAAGRAVALAAGVATIPLGARFGTVALGPEVGVACAVLAAVHPNLTRPSAEVLAETLYGLLVIVWALLVLRAQTPASGDLRMAVAGALGAFASLARVEGIALVPLTALAAIWSAERERRLRRLALALGGAALLLVPQALVVSGRTGAWAMSGKEIALVARKYGVHGSGIIGLVVGHPARFLATYPRFLARQIEYTLGELHILLLFPILVGLLAPHPPGEARRARRLIAATFATFTLGIALLNPGKRYVVPFIPLALPWAVFGAWRMAALGAGGMLGRTGEALARRGTLVAALALCFLALEGLRPPERATEKCYRSVCAWVREQFGGTPPPILAQDGRLAYLCGTRFVREPHGASTAAILARARTKGAGLWVVRARRRPGRRLEGLHEMAERCSGPKRLVIFEVARDGPGGKRGGRSRRAVIRPPR